MKESTHLIFVSLFLFLLFCAGCKKTADSHSDYPEIEVRFKGKGINTPLRLSDFIDSVKRIRISDEILIEQPKSGKYCNGLYYLADGKTHSIVMVNEEGEIVGQISRRGRARDEYTSLFDFDVNPRTGEISIYDQPGNKMVVYSSTGEYVRSFKMEVYRDFAVMDNGDYLCYFPDYSEYSDPGTRGLWLLDSVGEHKANILPMDDEFKHDAYKKHGYFCRMSNGSIRLLGVEDTDCLYDIDSLGNVRVACQLRYTPQMSASTRNTKPRAWSESSDYSYMKYWHAETDRWLFILSLSDNPSAGAFVVYDKINDKEYLCLNDADLINDVEAIVMETAAAPDRLFGLHYFEDSDSLNPEIVVAYLK